MNPTDVEIVEYIRHILGQNRKARLVFRKIADMLNFKHDNENGCKFTVISVKELERLKNNEKIATQVCDLAKQMVSSLGSKSNFEKKEQAKSNNK